MGIIGKEIKRHNPNETDYRFHLFWWFCCLLFMITFAFMTYLCWIEQSVMIAAASGKPNRLEEGRDAINMGYAMFTMFMLSLCSGFSHSSARYLIWLVLSLIWLAVVIWVNVNIGISPA